MMTPWFIATKKFDKSDRRWKKYIAWSRLTQLEELVSLDQSLCPTVLPDTKADYWPHIVNENYVIDFFTDLAYLRVLTAGIERKNLLCVFRDPPTQPDSEAPEAFEFVGYDLVEAPTGISALTNCGGFPDVFANSELSEKGLLTSHIRSLEVQIELRRCHPDEPHANCHLWAIFRAK
jgi:hypothetical protein